VKHNRLPLPRKNQEKKTPINLYLQLFFFLLGLVIALEIYWFQPHSEVWSNIRLWPSGEIWAIFLLVSAGLWLFSRKGILPLLGSLGTPLTLGAFLVSTTPFL
jgi:hypothetical protein